MPEQSLRVGIDASNLLHGGGVTHLHQLLHVADPIAAGIGEVIVWTGTAIAAWLPDRPWLRNVQLPVLDRPLRHRLAWQQFGLPGELRRHRCDILFAPGGLLPQRPGVPTITMSRNMLPFEPAEAARFGLFSPLWLKMQLLRRGQAWSMRNADGVVFLSNYARSRVSAALGSTLRNARTIPHGLDQRFFSPPRQAVAPEALDTARPFRLLYVSNVDVYKHQWQVVRAVAQLRQAGLPIRLDLVGSAVAGAIGRLDAAIAEVDPAGAFVTYHGGVRFDQLHASYREADAFVFASSCENLPNTLMEAMAAGLPIASSDMGPMPEVLGDAAVFFDPLDEQSIATAIKTLIEDPVKSTDLAAKAFERAGAYSWTRCARDTFAFIAEVARSDARNVA